MNLQRQILTAATATLVGLVSTVPAQAFSFGTGGIQFDKDTIIKFTFQRSGGYFLSKFGVVEVGDKNKLGSANFLFEEARRSDTGTSKNDYYGSCEGGVLAGSCIAEFTFKKDKLYSFFLDNGKEGRTVYSTTALNTAPTYGQQAKFFKASNVSESDIKAGGAARLDTTLAKSQGENFATLNTTALIGFEDVGSQGTSSDRDYNDFLVSATPVPEPATLGSLALVGGAVAMYRRRKASQVS